MIEVPEEIKVQRAEKPNQTEELITGIGNTGLRGEAVFLDQREPVRDVNTPSDPSKVPGFDGIVRR